MLDPRGDNRRSRELRHDRGPSQSRGRLLTCKWIREIRVVIGHRPRHSLTWVKPEGHHSKGQSGRGYGKTGCGPPQTSTPIPCRISRRASPDLNPHIDALGDDTEMTGVSGSAHFTG